MDVAVTRVSQSTRPGVHRPFVVAVVILGAGAILTGPVARLANVKADKLAIPLRAPLGTLAEEALHPYVPLDKKFLEPTILEALGTDQYLLWTLRDTSRPDGDPLSLASLLITYDTGGRNLVPHRPDVCFLGSGYEPAQMHENIEVGVDALAPPTLPIRVCTFRKTSLHDHRQISVVYTFHANGSFYADPYAVRVATNAPTASHAYFSKVEISFPLGATREQTVEGSRRLYARVLPVLIRDHWPDFTREQRVEQQKGP